MPASECVDLTFLWRRIIFNVVINPKAGESSITNEDFGICLNQELTSERNQPLHRSCSKSGARSNSDSQYRHPTFQKEREIRSTIRALKKKKINKAAARNTKRQNQSNHEGKKMTYSPGIAVNQRSTAEMMVQARARVAY